MKCLKCGGMQMLRCEHIGGDVYWFCPRCYSTTESTSNSEDKKYYVYKMSGHYYTIDTKPVSEKVLFEGTDKECYEFVKKELENV